MKRKIADIPAKLLNINGKGGADHAVAPDKLRPDSLGDRYFGVKAFFELLAQLGGSFGHGLHLAVLFAKRLGAFDARIKGTFFDVVADHFPVFFHVFEHGGKKCNNHRAEVGDISFH